MVAGEKCLQVLLSEWCLTFFFLNIILVVKTNMVKTGSAILLFFIVLKCKEIFPGVNLQPCVAGYFHLHFKVL